MKPSAMFREITASVELNKNRQSCCFENQRSSYGAEVDGKSDETNHFPTILKDD